MSIQVQQPETGFSIIPNDIIQNENLSAQARCLWAYLASLPKDWRPRASHLQKALGVGRDRLQAMCKELEGAGLLVRKPNRDPESGQVSGQVWELLHAGCLKNRQPVQPVGGKTRQAVNQAPYKETDHKDTKDKETGEGAASGLPAPAPALELVSEEAPTPAPKKKRRCQIGDWRPSDMEVMNAAAQVYGGTTPAHLESAEAMVTRFVDYHLAEGSVKSDWSAAWRIWFSREIDIEARRRKVRT